MGKIATCCSVFLRIIVALIALYLGIAFFFQWNNPKHSSLISNPKGYDMAPNFRGSKGEYFLNKDNLWIHYERYLPKGDSTSAKGILFMAHGYDTHAGHLAEPAQKIADATNLIVVTWDHQGFGLSEGDRLYYESISNLRDDFVQLVKEKTKEFNITKNVFCFGHSMSGALLIWDHLNRLETGQPQICQGQIISSAGVILDPPAEEFMKGTFGDIINFISETFPKMIITPFMEAKYVSTLPEFQEAWNNDPLIHRFMRARVASEAIQELKDIWKTRTKYNLPILAYVGTGDALANPTLIKKFVDESSSTDKTVKVYEGDAHSVLHDKHGKEALEDITTWLKQHTK